MTKEVIIFKDRDDLLTKLEGIVMKKSDVNQTKAFDTLKKLLKSYKRGDKDAVNKIIKLRKKILAAASYIDIELEEEGHFNLVADELGLLEIISTED